MAATPPAAAAPQIPALDDTFGVMFIGVVAAGALWGISCVQTYIYLGRYPSDSAYLKCLVGFVWAMDTVHQMFITHTLYIYLISNYFNPVHLNTVVWSLIGQVIPAAVVALIVQSFFGLRAFRLSQKNYIVGAVIGSLIIAEFVLSLIFTVKSFGFQFLTEAPAVHGISMAVNALAAAGDVAIAACLCVLLIGSKTGFSRSDSLIHKMVTWSLKTGLMTSVCAIAALVSIAAVPNGLIYTFWYFVLARLYTNSFLATLNGRQSLRETHLGTSDGTSLSMNDVSKRSRRPHIHAMSSEAPTTLSIKVDSETTTHGYYNAEQLPSAYGSEYKSAA